MSQTNIVSEDKTGFDYVQYVNSSLQAVATDFSGNSEPASPFADMKWLDTSTTPAVLKRRNSTNTAWVAQSTATSSGTLTAAAGWSDVPSLTPAVFNEQAQALLNRTEALNPDSTGAEPSALTGGEAWAVKSSGSWVKGTINKVAEFVTAIYTVTLRSGTGAVARALLAVLRDRPVCVNDFATIADAASFSSAALVFPAGNYTASSNLTFAARVIIEPGAVITASTGVTVTFSGGIYAGRSQIFAGAGTFVGNHLTTAAYPEWWGAVTGNASVDCAPAINKAIAFGAAQGGVDLSGSSNTSPYYTATSIVATRNLVWLFSNGSNAQIVTTTAANSTAPVFLAGDGVTLYGGFTLENITFVAQNVASSTRRAVVFNYCSGVKLKNVVVYGTQATRAWYDAIWLNSCVIVDIDRTSEISGATHAGIRLSGASGRKTLDVQCSARIQFNGTGYEIGPYCEGIFDRGSIIFSTDGYCVSINGSSSDSATVIKFFGTDFDTCTGAVYADYASNLLFDGCWASGISASAGSVVVLKSAVVRATFDGGRYFGNSSKKLFEIDADNIGVKNIEGSTCTEFVYMSASASRLQVQNNMFDGITTYAVNKLSGPDKVMITGNDFNGGVISTGGTNLTVANNT